MNYRNYTATQTIEWLKMEFQEVYSNFYKELGENKKWCCQHPEMTSSHPE
ncbi:putative uncharacterized protein [Blautia hydrogenotrophica CAG:147]|nr:putative uncharacterized protein [Blautia hydrogenotrophica CAG:147]CUN05815.1 Uncharacterised protein [Blautia hydrogenotrophica]SCI02626.1 Uncharacterised protein [uncultured Blautia sp.]